MEIIGYIVGAVFILFIGYKLYKKSIPGGGGGFGGGSGSGPRTRQR